METVMIKIDGIAPLLMHSCAGVNPLHPIKIEIAKITKKRNKTEEDQIQLLDLEYQLNAYYDETMGLYIPGECVEACLRDAAKKRKKGKDFTSAVLIDQAFIPLIYDGPRKIEELIKDQRYRDVRPVNVQRSKVLRCRPRFNKWGIEFMLDFDANILDKQDILNALDYAGKYIGLLDHRPRYGKFMAEMVS